MIILFRMTAGAVAMNAHHFEHSLAATLLSLFFDMREPLETAILLSHFFAM